MKEIIRSVRGTFRRMQGERLLNCEPDHVYVPLIGPNGVHDGNGLGEAAIGDMLTRAGVSFEGYRIATYQRFQEPHWMREVQEGDLLRVCTKFRGLRDAIISVNQWVEMQHWFVAHLGNVEYALVNERGLMVPIPDEVRVKLGVEPRRPPHISFRR